MRPPTSVWECSRRCRFGGTRPWENSRRPSVTSRGLEFRGETETPAARPFSQCERRTGAGAGGTSERNRAGHAHGQSPTSRSGGAHAEQHHGLSGTSAGRASLPKTLSPPRSRTASRPLPQRRPHRSRDGAVPVPRHHRGADAAAAGDRSGDPPRRQTRRGPWDALQLASLFLDQQQPTDALNLANGVIGFLRDGQFRRYELLALTIMSRAYEDLGDYARAGFGAQDVLTVAEGLRRTTPEVASALESPGG